MAHSYGALRKIVDGGLLACLSIGALYIGARGALTPRDSTQGAAVIFAPWIPADHALSRAVENGGRFVRFGGAPFIAVVVANDTDYPARMFHAGAWLVVDPQALAACSAALSRVTQRS